MCVLMLTDILAGPHKYSRMLGGQGVVDRVDVILGSAGSEVKVRVRGLAVMVRD